MIVGLLTTSSIYIWQSKSFNKTQKTILLFCAIFAPLQWFLIPVILYFNKIEKENTAEYKAEKKLNETIDKLKQLKIKAILTEEEFKTKIEKIEAEKTEIEIINSTEYKQLNSLLVSGILSKQEFDTKIINLKLLKKDIDLATKYVDLTLLDGKVLKVNIKNSNTLIGQNVDYENLKLNGNYLDHSNLYVIENNIIRRVLKPKEIVLVNSSVIVIYSQFSTVISFNDIVFMNDILIFDGVHKIASLKNFRTINGKIVEISYFLNLI